MLGRNRHGSRVGAGGGKGRGKGGKGSGKGANGWAGVQALADGQMGPAGAGPLDLWELNDWTQPGLMGNGRVLSFVASHRAGFISMDDDGPDVHFNPEHLVPPLDALFDKPDGGSLINTKVSAKVLYRANGHDRYTEEVREIADQ